MPVAGVGGIKGPGEVRLRRIGCAYDVAEHTDPADLEAGANVLLQVMCELAI
ncbi:hypothetical protein [Paraliomyxa miuraensis]|uniref:hypothetical protein n=1 Tax=Paraliomyxa miuraensis TaxID=376150 RepID=UPI00225B535D|nr:hypothetical protein [Paraliomyxa miuraensis]MCX4242318.1 hypothetical protein [Paraliomyxa miuraensis]